MLTRADNNAIRPVAATEATQRIASIADARQESFDRFSQLSLGKFFKAEVLSHLTDGSFTVKIADVAVRMNLPAGTQVGDKLDLTLVANQPRPTFLMNAPAAESDAKFSNTGRLIDNLLRTAQEQGAPTTLVGKAALVPSAAASATQVATALKDTLAFSGLFYESHVSQWASGSRSLTDLMREPQAKGSNPQLVAAALQTAAAATAPAQVDAADAIAHHALIAAHNPAIPQDADGTLLQTHVMHAANPSETPASTHGALNAHEADAPAQNGHAPNAVATAAAASTGALVDDAHADIPPASAALANADSPDAPPPPTAAGTDASAALLPDTRRETAINESARMVSLQLDTLEHQRVMWRGEVWPGQPMEWEVTEDAPDSQSAGAAQSTWQSVLRVELPVLGTVSATIRLTGERVQVQVRAASEATAALLRAHGDDLVSALDAAGSPLDLLTVKQDEAA
ncbi:flagellar hook-length control protein FliK [Noviherbaspirillum cavernae]|uniref:Flagellar hook-length control protein FliK n=1 Tax=Noviherbaspirillum cavernae TaxID=2320862 RepID=A0A418X0T8_9BURK|nr:flagellar hook-length control protein FliK [Noviherbaspirillum cavernae]RJG05963.1 flagellar hook-length control protein FliK [Noviherbaspirillum cavernae]